MSHDPVLNLLGLARKAGRLEIGEEPVGAACRARHARLIILAGDAAPNTVRRAAHFGQAGNVLWLQVPHTKAQLGYVLGRGSCAMSALTDVGLAAALAGHLASLDPGRYGSAAQLLRARADKALERQKEQRRHEKNLAQGRKKPWAPPAPESPRAPERPPRPSAKAAPKSGPHAAPSRPKAGPGGRPARPGPGGRKLSGPFKPKP